MNHRRKTLGTGGRGECLDLNGTGLQPTPGRLHSRSQRMLRRRR